MNYTPDEIMQYVVEEDVKFIRLAFCDIFGTQKNIAIMPDGLPAALADGVLIDASPITGFDGEMILKPDTATLMELPWRPQHGRVVHFFCDVCDAGGKPIETDPRTMLKDKLSNAVVGLEQTFYLMKLDDNGDLWLVRKGIAQTADGVYMTRSDENGNHFGDGSFDKETKCGIGYTLMQRKIDRFAYIDISGEKPQRMLICNINENDVQYVFYYEAEANVEHVLWTRS